jgi:tetratricopeptide (TPR) repeat protein
MTCEESDDGVSFCSPCPADEPEKPEMLSQCNSAYSQDVLEFIKSTELSHPAFLPDPNETVEALKAFLDGNEKAWKSKKKRLFDEPIDTGGLSIETWLEESVKRLLSVKEKYPESRHVFEGLGRIYWELYFHTRNEEYLKKAADAFICAEELGIKYGTETTPFKGIHYINEMTDILSILGDRERVDKYFSRLIKPTPDFTYLNYAKVLSKLNDERADEFFKKVISIRQEEHISPVVDYAEYLLDRGRDKEALSILQQLKPSEEYFYTHFLKGVALERIGRLKEAEKEYKKYLKFREPPAVDTGVYKAPSRYKIPGSKLQKDIPFDENSGISIMDIRSTPCGSTDWECKARYYMVYTINGEAEQAGVPIIPLEQLV